MFLFIRSVLAALLLLAASFTGCVLSAAPEAERTIVRAVYGEFYPYNFTNDQGDAAGYSVDLLRQLAQTARYDVEFMKADNPKQFFSMIKRGEVDVSPLLALTPERRAMGLATSELGQYELALFVRHDHEPIKIEGLAGTRVGVVNGSIAQAAAELLTDVEIVHYQTVDALVLPLLYGEIDAIIDVVETFEARLRSYDISDRVRKLQPSQAGIYHFVGSPDTSWAEFARTVFDKAGIPCAVNGIPTSEYPAPAARPLNLRMDCTRTSEVFGIKRPDWHDSLDNILAELGRKK